ncbi:hypothetical protein MLD38_005912 [Melastoma candidum]|uniref:Uncharacterized protein n=1 Tax=Melastoma candidum TaxID=119954 RepID=A0ACB9RLT0_9MYRT|nr:hypothetical protein MLD38_005912 [Melastoma candidum]
MNTEGGTLRTFTGDSHFPGYRSVDIPWSLASHSDRGYLGCASSEPLLEDNGLNSLRSGPHAMLRHNIVIPPN